MQPDDQCTKMLPMNFRQDRHSAKDVDLIASFGLVPHTYEHASPYCLANASAEASFVL